MAEAKRYPVKCVACHTEFSIGISLMMEFGGTDGHCGCTICKQFHHVHYESTTDSMVLTDWENWREEWAKKHADAPDGIPF
jgi:hypothetical protein